MVVTINGKPQQTDRDTTLAQLLERLEMNPRHVAVEVNLQLVPRGQHEDYVLHEGDRLEIVTLVGGG